MQDTLKLALFIHFCNDVLSLPLILHERIQLGKVGQSIMWGSVWNIWVSQYVDRWEINATGFNTLDCSSRKAI